MSALTISLPQGVSRTAVRFAYAWWSHSLWQQAHHWWHLLRMVAAKCKSGGVWALRDGPSGLHGLQDLTDVISGQNEAPENASCVWCYKLGPWNHGCPSKHYCRWIRFEDGSSEVPSSANIRTYHHIHSHTPKCKHMYDFLIFFGYFGLPTRISKCHIRYLEFVTVSPEAGTVGSHAPGLVWSPGRFVHSQRLVRLDSSNKPFWDLLYFSRKKLILWALRLVDFRFLAWIFKVVGLSMPQSHNSQVLKWQLLLFELDLIRQKPDLHALSGFWSNHPTFFESSQI